MSNPEDAVRLIETQIVEQTDAMQLRTRVAYAEINRIVRQGGRAARLALSLVGAELQAERVKAFTLPDHTVNR